MNIPWKSDRLPTPVFLGFPCGSPDKESTYNAGDLGSIPGSGDPLEKGMAICLSILSWRIPWTGKPGGFYTFTFHRSREIIQQAKEKGMKMKY